MYLFDLHVHTSEGSRCGRSTAKEIARAYAAAGCSGIVITDHFIHGYTAVSAELPWAERMQGYYDAYLSAKEEGDKLGLTVLFGVEHAFGGGQEVLVYNPDIDFLKAHPEIEALGFEEFSTLLRGHGAYLSLAHPYRERDYIATEAGVNVDPAFLDAIEVYNAGNLVPEENFRALYYAAAHGLGYTAGGDVHHEKSDCIGQVGVAFPHPITTGEELVAALKAGEGAVVCGGRPCRK